MITGSGIRASTDKNVAAGDLRRAAIAAFAWALLFGLVSMYWAAGGTIGESTLSRSIQDMAERREPAFVVTLWGTGIAKVIGGLVPMALAFGWWNGIPRRFLYVLCCTGGVLLLLYGLGDMTRAILVMTEVIEVDSTVDRDIARWYLLLWGPVWLTGGIGFLATAWHYRRSRASA